MQSNVPGVFATRRGHEQLAARHGYAATRDAAYHPETLAGCVSTWASQIEKAASTTMRPSP